MKNFLTAVVLFLGAIAIYIMYSYAIKNQPQLKFSNNSSSVMPKESKIVASYIKEALKKEKNNTIKKKEHTKLSIQEILNNKNSSKDNNMQNRVLNSPKALFNNIKINSNNINIKSENRDKNMTIEGTLIPTFVDDNKSLTKEQKEIIKAKKTPLKDRLKALNANFGDPVFIRIFKKSKELEVWIKAQKSKEYKLLKDYKICTYSGGLGPKLKEGDGISPEGFYSVDYGALNPNSRFHLSFNLGFPNEYDINHGRTGSYLMVHGKCVSTGCYAMGDKNIDEIYKLVKEALLSSQSEVEVHIFPFRLESKELAKYRKNRWYSFWLNLKEGYDAFNQTHIPPQIDVDGLKYVVTKIDK